MVHQTPRGLHTLPYNGMYFWPKIRGMKKDGPLGKIVPVIPIMVKSSYRSIKHMCGTRMTSPWHIIDWYGHYNKSKQEELN